jgi:hypothetical protein
VTTDAVAAGVLAQLGRWQLSWSSVAQISVGTRSYLLEHESIGIGSCADAAYWWRIGGQKLC